MTGYQNKVIHLAGDQQKGEVQLVVNLFQSVLDGFIRGEMKKEEAEPAKVKPSDSLWLCRIRHKTKKRIHANALCVVPSLLKQGRRGGGKIKV